MTRPAVPPPFSRCSGDVGSSFYVVSSKPVCAPCIESSAPKCGGCAQRLDGAYLSVLGAKWHPACFKCSRCDTGIAGPFYAISNKPVCTKCM